MGLSVQISFERGGDLQMAVVEGGEGYYGMPGGNGWAVVSNVDKANVIVATNVQPNGVVEPVLIIQRINKAPVVIKGALPSAGQFGPETMLNAVSQWVNSHLESYPDL